MNIQAETKCIEELVEKWKNTQNIQFLREAVKLIVCHANIINPKDIDFDDSISNLNPFFEEELKMMMMVDLKDFFELENANWRDYLHFDTINEFVEYIKSF